MKKNPIITFCFVALFFYCTTACSSASSKSFTSTEYGFSASFPENPTVSPSYDSSQGDTKILSTSFSVKKVVKNLYEGELPYGFKETDSQIDYAVIINKFENPVTLRDVACPDATYNIGTTSSGFTASLPQEITVNGMSGYSTFAVDDKIQNLGIMAVDGNWKASGEMAVAEKIYTRCFAVRDRQVYTIMVHVNPFVKVNDSEIYNFLDSFKIANQ